ncbi:hypothetical protein GBAR_LOCUS19976 [Geodia barretti]|uniref:FAM21/CAPZIP domain-containing protein n=2 Tax=Geodia barretti TaxID=519541 RepID=A0AA35SVS8_GEOBA|nr:hypothetical protein GBAR_LOCUS19976 [Geodia barretti]
MTKSIEERGGAKKEAPSTSRKPRQRKSSSGSGLFGELEEGEDDIFAFSGKKRPGSISSGKVEEKTKSTLSHSLFGSSSHDDTADLFSPKDKTPAMPPVADEPVSQKKSDTIDLFDKGGGEEEEDNLFGAPPNKSSVAAKKNSPPAAAKSKSDILFGSPSPPPDEGLIFGPPTTTTTKTPPPTTNHVTDSGESGKSATETPRDKSKESAPSTSKEKLGGLFDDDESDDDLFSSGTAAAASSGKKARRKPQVEDLFSSTTVSTSAAVPAASKKTSVGKQPPPATKKTSQKSTPSDLFGSPPTSDPLSGGGLFSGGSTSQSEPPQQNGLAPDQKEDNDKDLFASVSSAGKGASPSPRVVPKKSRKPSDSDVFTSSGSHQRGDAHPTPPPTQPKPPSKKPSDTDLFGTSPVSPTHPKSSSRRSSEADPPQKETPPTTQPKPRSSEGDLFTTSVTKKEEDLGSGGPTSPSGGGGGGIGGRKRPAGAVSLFGGVDILGDRGLEGSGLFGRSTREEDKLPTITEAKKPQPEVARKPKRSQGSSSDLTSPLSPPPTGPTPGKLKFGLHIDPAALLPGATPPNRAQEEKAISFATPVTTHTLFNPNKTRSRGAARRPPSRHALRASGSGSDSARTESLTSSLGGVGEETTPTKKKSAGTGIPITRPADPFADLISQSDSLPPLPKPEGGEEYGIFSSSKTKTKVTIGSGSEEDSLFGSVGRPAETRKTSSLPSPLSPHPHLHLLPPATHRHRWQRSQRCQYLTLLWWTSLHRRRWKRRTTYLGRQ